MPAPKPDRRIFTCEVCGQFGGCTLIVNTFDVPFDCPYGAPIEPKWEELINLSKEIAEMEVEIHA